jgi:hypothetical protein
MVLDKIVSFLKTDIKDIGKKKEKEHDQTRETIASNTIEIHNQALSEAKILGSIMKNLDNPFFSSADFAFYVDIKSSLSHNTNEYQGLNDSAELFSLAIKARETFLKLEQTELRYRSRKQQELYDFVLDLLNQKFASEKQEQNDLESGVVKSQRKTEAYYSPEEFKQAVRQKLAAVCQEIKTEEGQKPLQEYCDLLEELATKKSLGLKLLYLFKNSSGADFYMLKIIADMIVYLQDKDIKKLRAMEDLVSKNEPIFVQLGQIINVPKNLRHPHTFARLLQYVTFNIKYQSLLEQFSKIIIILKDWRRCYATVAELRARYPEHQYQLPEEFSKPIVGLDIYEKYNKYMDLNH